MQLESSVHGAGRCTIGVEGGKASIYEWNEMVQRMVDWLEDNLTESPTLLKMSQQLGYSPYYCLLPAVQSAHRDDHPRLCLVPTARPCRPGAPRHGRACAGYRGQVRVFVAGGVHEGFPESLRNDARGLPEIAPPHPAPDSSGGVLALSLPDQGAGSHERRTREAGGGQDGVHSGAQVHGGAAFMLPASFLPANVPILNSAKPKQAPVKL